MRVELSFNLVSWFKVVLSCAKIGDYSMKTALEKDCSIAYGQHFFL